MSTDWQPSTLEQWRPIDCPDGDEEGAASPFTHWLHDLRQPLTTLRRIAGALPLQYDGYVQLPEVVALEAACRQLEDMLESITDLHKVSTGDLVGRGARFDVRAAIGELVLSRQAKARAAGLHLGALLPGDRAFVISDRTLVMRMVSNLLENAFKHGHQGGRVTVSLQVDETHFCVEVQDDGPGFSPGFELTSAGSRRASGGGQGLGLLFCAHACRALGGQLALSEGPGAHLKVELPTGLH